MATILFIDDDEDLRSSTAELLELAGHQVITAQDGVDGIEQVRHSKPDLIVSDIKMPRIDGFGLLNIIRKDPQAADTPFIFLSCKSANNDYRQALMLGADDYIVKPFEGSDLLNSIDKLLTKHSGTEQITAVTQAANCEIGSLAGYKDPLPSILASSEIATYNRKQIIFKEGGYPRYLYFIRSGKVKTFKNHQDGKSLVMDLFGEAEFLGCPAILTGGFYTETAEVIEDCELVLIPVSQMEELKKNPRIMLGFMITLSKKLLQKEEQVIGFAYNSLRKKVAEALVAFEKKYNVNKNENFSIHISRDDLASIAGTATESLIRTLSEFKQEKLIEMDHHSITLINPSRLEHLLR